LCIAAWFVMLHDMEETRRDHRVRPVAIELIFAAIRLVAIGLIAVGISGIIAWGLGAVAGKAFVAGNPPGVTYTTARCREFLEYVPHARSCAAAATAHHFNEVVWYRLAAGVLGGAAFVALGWARRRRQPQELQPETFVPTVAAAVFGIAGIGLIGQGVDNVILKPGGGGGSYLSGGVVALVVASWFTIPIFKALTIRVLPNATA
jgi:hypothetical protein